MRKLVLIPLLILFVSLLPAANTLEAYLVDVEGTKAMLIVTPSGEAIMSDAGWQGLINEKSQIIQPDDRDTDRIIKVIKLAKIKQIDYMIVTHYDNDHVGNVPRLVAKSPVPVRAFVDHGPPVTENKATMEFYNAYLQAVGTAKRISVKPGDTIPVKGMDVRVVSSAGKAITAALPGAGSANQYCGAAPDRPDRGENPASVGVVYTFGQFRMIDLADLTKGMEYELMCPSNRVGTVDLLIVSHHGYNMSNSPALVHALHPRAAIMPNGAKKGGEAAAWDIIRGSPGLEDLWQMHYTVDVDAQHNAPEQFIANPEKEPDPKCYGTVLGDQGNWIRISAQSNGTFTVTNGRNGFSKTYRRQR
jgi:competence protein ComEC